MNFNCTKILIKALGICFSVNLCDFFCATLPSNIMKEHLEDISVFLHDESSGVELADPYLSKLPRRTLLYTISENKI